MRKAYRSDLTDEQWNLIKDLFPGGKSTGRPRKVDLREVVNTIQYQARTGCQWDYLPHDLLPKSTVWDYFVAWQQDGTWEKLVDALRGQVRTEEGREETPSAACIDSQTVKSTEMGFCKEANADAPVRSAMTAARRSRAASGISWSIPWGYCWRSRLRRAIWTTGHMLRMC
jgi:transposase